MESRQDAELYAMFGDETPAVKVVNRDPKPKPEPIDPKRAQFIEWLHDTAAESDFESFKNDSEFYETWLQNEGADPKEVEFEMSDIITFSAQPDELHNFDQEPKPKSKPVLKWTDTDVFSFEPKTVPVETVPNALVPLNSRLSLKDKFVIIEFITKYNTKQYKSNQAILNDLFEILLRRQHLGMLDDQATSSLHIDFRFDESILPNQCG
jgi:hypothetical protein